MATPTASPSISGLATSTSVTIASRATSSTSGPVMGTSLSFPLPARGRREKNCRSDRHLHDLFVGVDHLVANRDQGVDCNLGFGNRGDDVDDVSLAGRHRLGLGVGGLRGP